MPGGWKAKAGSRRILHHTFGANSEVYIGQLGGELRQMLDIWRFELQLEAMTDAEFVRDVTTAWRGVRRSHTAEALQRSSTMALQRATSGKWRHSVATSTSLPTEVSVAAAITSAGTPSAASSTSGGSSGQDGHV